MKMDLTQLPYNSTLMGCIQGAATFYKTDLNDVMLYGLSGHAFVININTDLCPSGPYVWDMSGFQNLCQNIGLIVKINQAVFLNKDSKKEFINKCEEMIKEKMNSNTVCMLVSLEYQLFNEYDNQAFIFTKPWGKVNSETDYIEFGKWINDVNGYTFIEKNNKSTAIKKAINQSLCYAMTLIEKEEADGNSHLGICAYDYWIECITKGHGYSHGNWWNGMVWEECRTYAAKYFLEIIKYGYEEDICRELSCMYEEISQLLHNVKNKELKENKKIEYLEKAKTIEKSATFKIKKLIK